MTDTQISAIKKGDTFIDREGVVWIAVLDAQLEVPATTNQTHQARLVSRSGRQSMKLTYRNASQLRRL